MTEDAFSIYEAPPPEHADLLKALRRMGKGPLNYWDALICGAASHAYCVAVKAWYDADPASYGPCPYGDPTCPCADGDPCHYEGEAPMRPPGGLTVASGVKWWQEVE